jgi:hypothetical protein
MEGGWEDMFSRQWPTELWRRAQDAFAKRRLFDERQNRASRASSVLLTAFPATTIDEAMSSFGALATQIRGAG